MFGCGLTVLASPSPSQSSLIMWSFLVAIFGSRQTSFIWNALLIYFCFPSFLLRDAIHWFPLIYLMNSHGFWISHIPNSLMYLFLLSTDFLSIAFATFCHSHLWYISYQNVLQIIVLIASIFTYKNYVFMNEGSLNKMQEKPAALQLLHCCYCSNKSKTAYNLKTQGIVCHTNPVNHSKS